MPIVSGPAVTVGLLGLAPNAALSPSVFAERSTGFFDGLVTMVSEVNTVSSGFATPLTALPVSPTDRMADFASVADALIIAMPGLVGDVNGMIAQIPLTCGAITTLPTAPSRGSDPAGFGTEAALFVAAMTLLRTELNAFITALNAYGSSTGTTGTQRQAMVPTLFGVVCVDTSTAANKQYMLPGGSYLDEET